MARDEWLVASEKRQNAERHRRGAEESEEKKAKSPPFTITVHFTEGVQCGQDGAPTKSKKSKRPTLRKRAWGTRKCQIQSQTKSAPTDVGQGKERGAQERADETMLWRRPGGGARGDG